MFPKCSQFLKSSWSFFPLHLPWGISASGFARPRHSGRCLLLCAGRGSRLGAASPARRGDALRFVSPSCAKRSPSFPREGSLPHGGRDALLGGSVPMYPPLKLYGRRLQLLTVPALSTANSQNRAGTTFAEPFFHPLPRAASPPACPAAPELVAPEQQILPGGERLPGYFPFRQEMSHGGSTRAVLCRAVRT